MASDIVAEVIDTTCLEGVSMGIIRQRLKAQGIDVPWAQVGALREVLLARYPELAKWVLDSAHLDEHDERRRADAHPDGADMDWQEIESRRLAG